MRATTMEAGRRIKVLLPIYGLDGGGAERVVANLANHLDPNVFDPVLVLLHSGGQYREEIRSHVKVIEL